MTVNTGKVPFHTAWSPKMYSNFPNIQGTGERVNDARTDWTSHKRLSHKTFPWKHIFFPKNYTYIRPTFMKALTDGKDYYII